MKKYILKSGKEVKFGDIIYARNVTGYPSIMLVTLDEDSVDTLKELDVIIEKDIKDEKDKEDEKDKVAINNELVESYIKDVHNYIGNKLSLTIEEVIDYMASLYKICPIAVLNIYLKRISYKLNKKYDKTPIRNLSKIYIISTYNGKVSSVCPKDIKNLKHFAWFRSKEDAEFARKCVIGLITDMFGKDDQSKD